MTDEEVTYDMARRTVNLWRQQLKRTQQRLAVLESRATPANLTMATFTAGMAEGLAQAIREMDRTLDESPTCKHLYTETTPRPMTMAEAMNREPDPATDEGYGPRAVND